MKHNLKNDIVVDCSLGTFLVIVLAGLGAAKAETCDQEELLKCAYPLRVLTAGNKELGFVARKEELDQLCPSLNSGLECIDSYTQRCMSEDKRHQFNHLYSGTSMVIHDLCNEGPYQEEFLRHAPCMRLVKSDYEDCATHYTQMIQDVNNQEQSKGGGESQMRTVCCSFQDYLTCSEDTVMKQCGAATANFTQGFLDRMSSSLIKDHCREYLPSCMDAISGAFNSSAMNLINWMLLLLVNATIFFASSHCHT